MVQATHTAEVPSLRALMSQVRGREPALGSGAWLVKLTPSACSCDLMRSSASMRFAAAASCLARRARSPSSLASLAMRTSSSAFLRRLRSKESERAF